MDWTVSPLYATNPGLYQSQQPASGFSQANTSTQNFSVYIGNDQAINIHSSAEKMVPNQLSPQNNFHPPLQKSSVPVTGFGTIQHFVGQHPPIQFSNMTVQMTSGMAKNTWPNSNAYVVTPVAPQLNTANPGQRVTNWYAASDMYNNRPPKNCSNSVQGSVSQGNINRSRSKRLPVIVPKYRPSNPQTHATETLNRVPSYYLNSQQNSSFLTFSSGQNVQNQTNDINSGTAPAMQSQQYGSNFVYSSPYTIPAHFAAPVIPQATNTNLPPPPYAVPPIQINHGQFVQPQPVPNTSNENVQNPQNLELGQSVSCSVQHVQIPEVGGAADSIHGHGGQKQPSDDLTKSLQIPGTVPLDKTSAPQTTRSMVEGSTAKSSGNDSLNKFKERLILDKQEILALRNKLANMQGQFKLRHQLYLSVAQKSKTSDPSVHNPEHLLPTSNTSQQSALLPQATNQTFSPPSHNATQNLPSSLPHDSSQIHPPSLLTWNTSQLKDKAHLHPILKDLLKGTYDEEMLLNLTSTARNQNKQLFSQEKCFSGSVPDSSGVKSDTRVNDMETASRRSPKMSQTVSTQVSLTSANVSQDFERTSALDKDQLTNMSAISGGGFIPNKDKVGTTITNPQSTTSVQNPAESSQLIKKIAEEGSKNSQNPRSELIQQRKDYYLQTPYKTIAAWNNGNDTSSSASPTATVPDAVQRSSFSGNSCTMGRTCSLEELETSLALWRKIPAASLSDQLSESTKSAMRSSLDGVEDKEIKYTMKNFPNALTHYEKSRMTVGKNESTHSSVSSSLGQKLDAISSSPSKSSEPQVAIVSPLILLKEKIQNKIHEKNLSSMSEKMYPVIAEGSVHSLHEFVTTLSDTDKSVTVKKLDSYMLKSTEENGIERAESGTAWSCDPNQGIAGSLELGKNSSQLCSSDSFSAGTNKDSSNPFSHKCTPKTSSHLVEPGDTVLNENMLQISSVCTLVQGDAFYNSQIANIFNACSKAKHNTCSEGQRLDSYNKEQQLSHLKSKSEINESTSVGDTLLPSADSLSKAIAEKLLGVPSLEISQSGKVSNEVNVRESEEEKNTELVNPNSGKDPKQNMSCSDVHSRDLSSGNPKVPGNSTADEGNTHGIQDYIPSYENQVHSMDDIDIALASPDDQLTELLKEFPYGIDDSKALKKTGREDSATKVNEIKDGQEAQTCGQNSEANNALDQLRITILNPRQMKELFPENSSQSSNKLENTENNKLTVASENTNKSHIPAILVGSPNTSTQAAPAKKTASQSFCCATAWLGLTYAVEPCEHMLAKEAALKQQLVQSLPSEIIIKEELETNETSSTNCRLSNQQHTMYPVTSSLPSEVETNRILSKPFAGRDKGHKSLKEDKRVTPSPFLEKLEPLKPKYKQQGIEELPEKVPMDKRCNQKRTTLLSKSQEWSYSGTEGKSIGSACKKESSDKERTPKETVVDNPKSDTLQRRSMEKKHGRKREKYKIKRDSSETHIIKGPTYTLKRGLKKHIASEGKQKTNEKPCSTVTNSSNFVSKAYNNAQYSQEHLNRQKCDIERDLESNKAEMTEHSKSSSSEPVKQNKASFARTSLKKFAYLEEKGNVWKYRRSLSDNIKTSKVQPFRGQHRNIYKTHSLNKEVVWGTHKRDKCFAKTLSDKKSPCNRKSNILTLQREQKKNYLNKVAFKQTEQSICLTKLEHSPSKSIWHVKSSSAPEHPEDKKSHIPSSQQSEAAKPQMLEFKMCPEIVFRNLVSEDVSDAKKVPEKERIPVSAVKSRREDWLNYSPQKRRKTDEKETQDDDRIPLDTAMELLDKNEVIKNSNATFETYRKMHLEKSRSLDSSPIN